MSNETGGASDVEPLACPTCARKYPLSERFCADCEMPLVYVGRGEEEPITGAHEKARKVNPQYTDGSPGQGRLRPQPLRGRADPGHPARPGHPQRRAPHPRLRRPRLPRRRPARHPRRRGRLRAGARAARRHRRAAARGRRFRRRAAASTAGLAARRARRGRGLGLGALAGGELAPLLLPLFFQPWAAGVGSALAAESIARIRISCLPRFFAFTLTGELQAANDASSSEHSKVEPTSDEKNSKLTNFFLVFFGGPSEIVVSGGEMSGAGPISKVRAHPVPVPASRTQSSVTNSRQVPFGSVPRN